MGLFKLSSKFQPKGDQPKAIEALCENIKAKKQHQVLLGVTGSGKTFTLANVIAKLDRPTLIAAPNKTLAAQLYEEFKEFFPENSVRYFVSYYDFYQPEAYIPSTDTFIEKDSQINEEIDRMRHAATHALFTRKDIIIIASVSFIYGLGSPELYNQLQVHIETDQEIKRNELLEKLVEIQYERNDVDFHRGCFRVRGDTIDIFPAYEEELALRVEFFGDMIDSISEIDPLRGKVIRKLNRVSVYPASHYVTEMEMRRKAINSVNDELGKRLKELKSLNKDMEAKRLEQRTIYDLEMLEELGYCQGVENYSRHLTGRDPGDAPPTLMEYFPDDFLMVVDESHVSIPQIGGMYRGDRARKMNLVEFGFRLPSALDNRPLNFDEFSNYVDQKAGGIIYVSATPADYEMEKAQGEIVEQVIRPTGLLDPEIHIKSAKTQVDDLVEEIKKRVADEENKSRILVTVLTKKFAEDLTVYLQQQGILVRYLHSDIDTLERIEILRDLRLGLFDVLVGINLLREGLDLPEVSLVAIMDADKEGFLRSSRSLIQTIGRAARNVEGTVILYCEKITQSMDHAINETRRRRKLQSDYNKEHGITPQTVKKQIAETNAFNQSKSKEVVENITQEEVRWPDIQAVKNIKELQQLMKITHQEMLEFANDLKFEEAAKLRDKMKVLKQLELKWMA